MAKKPDKPERGDGKPSRPPKDMGKFFETLMGPMETWPDPDADEFGPDPISDMLELFTETGALPIAVAILQPADAFLDTVGEDIRRRLFVTEGPNGEQLCLRPEFTIPVCLDYLASDEAGTQQAYSYVGPVFRQRVGEPFEFPQAGIERFGDTDALATDADLLRLAVDVIECFGLDEGEIRIGDEGLFSALLDALDLSTPVRRRLRAAFGDAARMEKTLASLTARDGSDIVAHAGFLGAISGNDEASARKVVEDLLAIAGIAAVGTRSAEEIAARFLEKAAATATGGLTEEKAAVIRAFFSIEAPPTVAELALRRFATGSHLDLTAAIDAFAARNAAIASTGLDLDAIAFSTRFGRNPDYYTGFVFEIVDPDRVDGKPVVGGGRYDGLLERLGAGQPIPAAGFSIWLDRLSVDLGLLGIEG